MEKQIEHIQSEGSASKKPYAAPSLIEYGSIAKLTQGGGSTLVDGNNMRQ